MTVGVAVGGGNSVPLRIVEMNVISSIQPSVLVRSEKTMLIDMFGFFSASNRFSCSVPCILVEFISIQGIRCSVVPNVTSSVLEFSIFNNHAFFSSISLPVHSVTLKPLSTRLTFRGGKFDMFIESDVPVSEISTLLCGISSVCSMNSDVRCTLHIPAECSYGRHDVHMIMHSFKFATEHLIVNPLPVVSKLEPNFVALSEHRLITVHGENFEFFNFGAFCRIGTQVVDAIVVHPRSIVLNTSGLLFASNTTSDIQFVYLRQTLWTSSLGLPTKNLAIKSHSPTWLWTHGGTITFQGDNFHSF